MYIIDSQLKPIISLQFRNVSSQSSIDAFDRVGTLIISIENKIHLYFYWNTLWDW